MKKEIVIRNPDNKRIKQMVKVDITTEIQLECKRSVECIFFQYVQNVSNLFQLVDNKQTYGILAEIAGAIIGLDEYRTNRDKKYLSQYKCSYNKLYFCLVNLSNQLIFLITHVDIPLDQPFIKKTIQAIFNLNEKYISESNMFSSQKELLNGHIKRLIEIYNIKLNHAIQHCEQNNSWQNKLLIFAQSIDPEQNMISLPEFLIAYNNVLVFSENQNQYKQHLEENKINIVYSEGTKLEST